MVFSVVALENLLYRVYLESLFYQFRWSVGMWAAGGSFIFPPLCWGCCVESSAYTGDSSDSEMIFTFSCQTF